MNMPKSNPATPLFSHEQKAPGTCPDALLCVDSEKLRGYAKAARGGNTETNDPDLRLARLRAARRPSPTAYRLPPLKPLPW